VQFIYVAGLEHSGTTLLAHLLGAHPATLCLGEVAIFFSPTSMRQFMSRWGKYPDAQLCSCGKSWDDCEFWGDLMPLCGLRSEAPLLEKYAELVRHVHAIKPGAIVIDSSKGLSTLDQALVPLLKLKLPIETFSVALALKDVRSFTASIAARDERSPSVLSNLRTFNWWLGENRKFLQLLDRNDVPVDMVLYEALCADPGPCLRPILRRHGLDPDVPADVSHNRSHIVIGNKSFLRRRDRVVYDQRWFGEDSIHWAYLLHRSARRFNARIYQMARVSAQV
jgi:hypothetical protein